jgi:hypothetical protein
LLWRDDADALRPEQKNPMHTPSPRSATRGVTRFEVAATATAVALFAAIGLWFSDAEADVTSQESALENARSIANAAAKWRSTGTHQGCPSIGRLVEDKALDEESRTDDPWGKRYRIQCDDERVTVQSAGLDQKSATADDILVSEPWAS